MYQVRRLPVYFTAYTGKESFHVNKINIITEKFPNQLESELKRVFRNQNQIRKSISVLSNYT